jgi:putative ABC transport system substrate-binding protein
VLVLGVAATAAMAQPAKNARVGFLTASDVSSLKNRFEAFRKGMKELGYEEGRNLAIEIAAARGEPERLPILAAELEGLKVDVILTAGPSATRAAMLRASSIPIVMGFDTDPVAAGFAVSLARPGGNVTGLSSLGPEVSAKQIDIAKQIVPKLSRLAILGDAQEPANSRARRETEGAARKAAMQPSYFDVRAADLEDAFRAMREKGIDVLIVLPMPANTEMRARMAKLATQYRLPVIYPWPEFVHAGGLMTYSVNQEDLFRRAATYVDKILKGARPGELPIEQPQKLDLVINLKAAQAIGLKIPVETLTRADVVQR